MTQTTPQATDARPTAQARFGYVVAIALNVALLYVVNKLPEWESPGFLTDDLEQVLPIVSLSLVASIVLNVINLMAISRAWKRAAEIGSAVIALVATVRILQVFPFDFSTYEVNWEPLTRVILVLAIVGITIGIIAQAVKLGVELRR